MAKCDITIKVDIKPEAKQWLADMELLVKKMVLNRDIFVPSADPQVKREFLDKWERKLTSLLKIK